MQKIDYAKLLGFDAVSGELAEGVDFQNDTVSATLGAKVGNGGNGHRLRANGRYRLTLLVLGPLRFMCCGGLRHSVGPPRNQLFNRR